MTDLRDIIVETPPEVIVSKLNYKYSGFSEET
jgi:hypothetical protein